MKILFFANTDWYLYNFRLALAKFLRDHGFEVVMLSPVGPYGPLLQAEGFRWIGLDMNRRSLNPVPRVQPDTPHSRRLRGRKTGHSSSLSRSNAWYTVR